jgi:hypothetical protein
MDASRQLETESFCIPGKFTKNRGFTPFIFQVTALRMTSGLFCFLAKVRGLLHGGEKSMEQRFRTY